MRMTINHGYRKRWPLASGKTATLTLRECETKPDLLPMLPSIDALHDLSSMKHLLMKMTVLHEILSCRSLSEG